MVTIEEVLRAVHATNREPVVLGDDQWPTPGASAREVDHVLLELRDEEFLIEGIRQGWSDHNVLWTGMRVELDGLVMIGEWPQYGHETDPGPWDEGLWGRHAVPVIAALAASTDLQNLPFRRFSPTARREHDALKALRSSGLLVAEERTAGLTQARLSRRGRALFSTGT